jgi:PAS domain S-box-containing protein
MGRQGPHCGPLRRSFYRGALERLLTMGYPGKAKRIARPAASVALRYGLAVVSVAAAFGLAQASVYFHLPQPFAALALSAIAITFWYGGTNPGIVATLLALLVRDYFFEPEINAVSRVLYSLVFLIFALVMMRVTRARNELELRVAQRTAELTGANKDLKLEIAERKRAETELRLAIDTIPALVWTTLPDGSLDFINRRWAEIGLSLDDLRGSKWSAVMHPDERAGVVAKWRTAVETGTPYENVRRVRRADGEYRWFLSRGAPLRDELGKIIKWYGAETDIEDRKRAEEALRESEQRFRDYAETASDWLWETGPDHRFTRVSQHLDATGVLPPSRIGLTRWDYASDVESRSEEWRRHRAMLDAHQPFRDFLYSATRRDGSTVYLRTSGKPIFDAKGTFLGYRGVATDVTAAVRAEQAEEALRNVQTELEHVTRVTTLGELTASIAHEVNQPLAAIVTNGGACLRWLARDVPEPDEVRSAVERMIDDANRAAEVIRRVRALSKKTDAMMVPLPINDVIDEAILLVRHEVLSHRALLHLELASGLPLVLGDRIQLQQVIINLVMNGMEAMAPVSDRPRELEIRSRREADAVLVAVQDSGVGIDPEHVERLFDAFFTTKPSGMGMGLSICRSIIEAHGGKLRASRNIGAGATFEFTLPAYQEGAL